MSIGNGCARHFACGSSEGPNVANLQLNFWRHALDRFRDIQSRWRQHAISEEQTAPEDLSYTENEFLVDAATAIVLAGTSITELVGQNTEPEGNVTPSIRKGLAQLVPALQGAQVDAFLSTYDGLRHFGPAKHEAIWNLSEELFCQHMEAAQRIWVSVLEHLGITITDDFRQRFVFE